MHREPHAAGRPGTQPRTHRRTTGLAPGAIDVCRRLEKTYPRWTVFWTSGSQTATEPGYRAILWQHDHRAELYAATAEETLAQLVKVDAEVPPPFNELPPYAPLV